MKERTFAAVANSKPNLRVKPIHISYRGSMLFLHPQSHRLWHVHSQSPHMRNLQPFLFDPPKLLDLFHCQIGLNRGMRCLLNQRLSRFHRARLSSPITTDHEARRKPTFTLAKCAFSSCAKSYTFPSPSTGNVNPARIMAIRVS